MGKVDQAAFVGAEAITRTHDLKPPRAPSESSSTFHSASGPSDRILAPVAPLIATARAFTERVSKQFAGEEWEAIVGGSWLNKLGVLVLVIGISLFLGHALTHHGPIARIATGLGLLIGGVVMEHRAR